MKNSWAVGTITDEFIATSNQLGVKNIIHYGGPGQTDWIGRGRTYEEYKEIVDTLKSNGLNLASFEGGFVGNPHYWDIFAGGPKRDEQIEDLISQIRDMARAGVPAYGYNWMPLGWVRSDPKTIRGDASATAFNAKDKNLVFGGKDEIKSIGDKYELTKESIWQNLEYWIKAVTPIAEEEGIRLGIHPDDPPVDNLGGVPRIMTSFDAFKRLIEIYPSDSNAIEFCQGTFSEMDEDIYEMIEYFASRNKILYVHFRNVSAPNPNEFNEEFINTCLLYTSPSPRDS